MKSSLYDLVELEGKGVGCIASQDIEKGTVILREKPQFAVKGGRSEWMKRNWLKEMMNAHKTMTQKEEFFKLLHDAPPRIKSDRKAEIVKAFGSKNNRNCYGSPCQILKIFCIIEANGFSCFESKTWAQPRPETSRCLFESTYLAIDFAKFNHSCLPNAERTKFLKADGSLEIVAVTKIKKGEEITISYSWSVGMKSRKSRQEIIQSRFYFDCICKFCQEEAGYYNNDLKIYKEFDNLVEKVVEFDPKFSTTYFREYETSNKLTTADSKKWLIILKEMYKLGETKNLGPSGKYQIVNQGYIAAFKIVCNVTDNSEFKADAQNFATEGKKLQELYNFPEPEPGEWTKRGNVDEYLDNLIKNSEYSWCGDWR